MTKREHTKLSERFADRYQECQEAFRFVLLASRDADKTEAEFATMCGALTRKLLRLKQLGDAIAQARGEKT